MEARTAYPHLKYYAHTDTESVGDAHFERHCHDHCELLYVIHGRGKVVVEGVEYPMKSNTLFLIRPYEFHYVRPERGTRYERCVLEFDPSFPEGAAAELPFLSRGEAQTFGVCFSSDQIGEEIREIFSAMDGISRTFIDAENRHAKEETMMRAYVTLLLLRLSLPEPRQSTFSKGDLCVQVIHYLNRHLHEPISLDALAKRFFVSKYHLCHAFRRHTGVSILAYVQGKRIAMAEYLLSRGEPATEVAFRVGFSNYSSFYRAYCKQMGVSPVRSRQTDTNAKENTEMTIRKAHIEELSKIMEIYTNARAFMRASGNPTQWSGGYPGEDLIREDIARGHFYVCEDIDGLAGVFYFAKEEDPTYARIYDGAWLNDKPYAVIHRIAVAKQGRGVVSRCFDFAFAECNNLKIDTHKDNLPMQKALTKNGFLPCGTIFLANGDPRIAYQKSAD